jgi:hypothetical protein
MTHVDRGNDSITIRLPRHTLYRWLRQMAISVVKSDALPAACLAVVKAEEQADLAAKMRALEEVRRLIGANPTVWLEVEEAMELSDELVSALYDEGHVNITLPNRVHRMCLTCDRATPVNEHDAICAVCGNAFPNRRLHVI